MGVEKVNLEHASFGALNKGKKGMERTMVKIPKIIDSGCSEAMMITRGGSIKRQDSEALLGVIRSYLCIKSFNRVRCTEGGIILLFNSN